MGYGLKALAVALALSPMPACATLLDRGGMIYDSVQNITWLKDANYAKTTSYPAANQGRMEWSEAVSWADSLVYGGFNNWKLPKIALPDPS